MKIKQRKGGSAPQNFREKWREIDESPFLLTHLALGVTSHWWISKGCSIFVDLAKRGHPLANKNDLGGQFLATYSIVFNCDLYYPAV